MHNMPHTHTNHISNKTDIGTEKQAGVLLVGFDVMWKELLFWLVYVAIICGF